MSGQPAEKGFISTPEELLAKMEQDPESLTGIEKYAFGLAFVGSFLDPQTLELLNSNGAEEIEAALEGGISLLMLGLNETRVDKNLSEKEKLNLGLGVLRTINFKELPEGGLGMKLYATAWLMMAAGLKAPITERLKEVTESLISGHLVLAAMLVLGDKVEELKIGEQLHFLAENLTTANEETKRDALIAWVKEKAEIGELTVREQLDFLAENLKTLDEKIQKDVLLAWAKENAKTEPDSVQGTQFFWDRGDKQTGFEVTMEHLKLSFGGV